MEIMSNKKRRS